MILFHETYINCESFLSQVKSFFDENRSVDNSFSKNLHVDGNTNFKQSTESIVIPIAVDSRGNVIDLELGGSLSAHAMLFGSSGSGKSSALHTIITSIILNYHPDDVELWLVDYDKVEFAEYVNHCPPHIKLLGIERGDDFTYGLLDMIDGECKRRMELFKSKNVSDITQYKSVYGVTSLPRIVLVEMERARSRALSHSRHVEVDNVLERCGNGESPR